MMFLLDESGPKPRDRVLIRHRREETWMQRRSHMKTEAGIGGRGPPAQGWMPGAPRSWKRQEAPYPRATGQSSALGHHGHLRTVSRTGGGWMSVAFSQSFGVLSSCRQHKSDLCESAGSSTGTTGPHHTEIQAMSHWDPPIVLWLHTVIVTSAAGRSGLGISEPLLSLSL